jgi:hypothetical protein
VARFNEILRARTNEALSRFFGMENRGPAPTLAPEVLPTYDVINAQAENLWIRNELRGGLSHLQGAVPAQRTVMQLWNLAGSNKLAVLERVWTNGTVFIATTNVRTVLGGSVNLTPAAGDTRAWTLGGSQNAGLSLAVRTGNVAIAGIDRANFWLLLTNMNWEGSIVIAPNSGVHIYADADNVQRNLACMWRERPADASELAL